MEHYNKVEFLIIREAEEAVIMEIPRYGMTKGEALENARKWWKNNYGSDHKDRILLLEGIKRIRITKKL